MNLEHQEASTDRVAIETIDHGGIYSSRVLAAGPLVFFGGTACGPDGQLASEAKASPPYHLSPAAEITQQGTYLFTQVCRGLEQVGSGLENILQVEQFIPAKVYADGHVTNRSEILDNPRPTTMMGATGSMAPEGAVLSMFGIASRSGGTYAKEAVSLPQEEVGGGLAWSDLGDAYEAGPPYTDILLAGPYVFVTGEVTADAETGHVASEARVADWIWVGSEARNEAQVLSESLQRKLQQLGSDLRQVIHITLFMTDIADLFEVDRVWKKVFDDTPPARTIVPVRGVGVPRREGRGMGHEDGAVKLEQQVRALRPGYDVEIEAISTDAGRLAHEEEAIKAGSFVWLSHQYPVNTAKSGSLVEQVKEILERVSKICEAAGTTLSNLTQLRVFALETATGEVVAEQLRNLIPENPPVVATMTVPAPLLVPGAQLFVDAIAFADE